VSEYKVIANVTSVVWCDASKASQDLAAEVTTELSSGWEFLRAGLVDEMEINLVPTLLGRGERLLDGVGDDLHGLKLVRTIATPRVVHVTFARSVRQ
jgi:hypothetical protein